MPWSFSSSGNPGGFNMQSSGNAGGFFSPFIITDGLVVYLDAGNTTSYPGSGTTWTDLSGAGNNGTLVNSPVFNSANGGSIEFNKINDYATIAHATSLNLSSALTISAWFFSGTITTPNVPLYLKGRTDTDNYNPLFEIGGRYGWTDVGGGRSFYSPPANFIVADTWYNLTVTHTSTNTPVIYRNGVAASGFTFTEGTGARPLNANSNPVGISQDVPRGLHFAWNGRVAQLLVYNRALTAEEVRTNVNSIRGRFNV
jgi:hypothetical protein